MPKIASGELKAFLNGGRDVVYPAKLIGTRFYPISMINEPTKTGWLVTYPLYDVIVYGDEQIVVDVTPEK